MLIVFLYFVCVSCIYYRPSGLTKLSTLLHHGQLLQHLLSSCWRKVICLSDTCLLCISHVPIPGFADHFVFNIELPQGVMKFFRNTFSAEKKIRPISRYSSLFQNSGDKVSCYPENPRTYTRHTIVFNYSVHDVCKVLLGKKALAEFEMRDSDV